jgi:hypothetical protein
VGEAPPYWEFVSSGGIFHFPASIAGPKFPNLRFLPAQFVAVNLTCAPVGPVWFD